jgi:hypothetical protein
MPVRLQPYQRTSANKGQVARNEEDWTYLFRLARMTTNQAHRLAAANHKEQVQCISFSQGFNIYRLVFCNQKCGF